MPVELKRLFINLQTSNERSLAMDSLTRSFGWPRLDAYQQHDVQELMRVLFETLKKLWVETSRSSLIKDLYQEEMADLAQCKKCGYQSLRRDNFLDISLVLRPSGSKNSYKSVEEAMSKFIEPEVLEGDNKYYCDKCVKKVDALKSLKFTQFPYILALKLKRFDYDNDLNQSVKNSDQFTFP